jgi:hypothetical protein
MAVATTASSCAGAVIVGFCGQLSRMTGGSSDDSTNSIRMASAWLMAPRAN